MGTVPGRLAIRGPTKQGCISVVDAGQCAVDPVHGLIAPVQRLPPWLEMPKQNPKSLVWIFGAGGVPHWFDVP